MVRGQRKPNITQIVGNTNRMEYRTSLSLFKKQNGRIAAKGEHTLTFILDYLTQALFEYHVYGF